MDASRLYQDGNEQLLADSCQWSPVPPRDTPAPLWVYPLPQHMPDDPGWISPVQTFGGTA